MCFLQEVRASASPAGVNPVNCMNCANRSRDAGGLVESGYGARSLERFERKPNVGHPAASSVEIMPCFNGFWIVLLGS